MPILEVTLLTASDAYFDHFKRISVTDKKNPVAWSYPNATDIGSPFNSYLGILRFVKLRFKTIFLYEKLILKLRFCGFVLFCKWFYFQFLFFLSFWLVNGWKGWIVARTCFCVFLWSRMNVLRYFTVYLPLSNNL